MLPVWHGPWFYAGGGVLTSGDDIWIVVCAGCGKSMPIWSLLNHWNNKHNWKTRADGSVNHQCNSLWNVGGTPP